MEAHGQSGGQSWTRGNCWKTANAASSILQICEVPLFPMSQGSRRGFVGVDAFSSSPAI
jgi:hypothetical protein